MSTATSWVQYVGDGVTQSFSIPFAYLQKGHVKCSVGAVPRVQDSHYYVEGGTLTFNTAFIPAAGQTILIDRQTPFDPLVSYQNGSVLTADDLNLANKQAIYLIQEVVGKWNTLLDRGAIRLSNGEYSTIQDMIDAVTGEILASELFEILSTNIEDVDVLAADLLAQTVRVDDLQTTVDAFAADLDNVDTLILQEQTERIEGDTALAQTLALVGAKSGDGLSFILDQNTVYVSPAESLGTRLSAIDTRLGDNEAAIINEAATRIDADGVFAANFALLGARNPTGTLWIIDENKVYLGTQGTSMAGKFSTIQNQIGNVEADIYTEQQSRISADGALASDITTLQTNVGDNQAAIQTHSSTLDGLTAQYFVKTDVNGRVAGFGLYSSSTATDFIILADRFAIVDPNNNATVRVPFSVSGGVAYLQNVVVGGALIDQLGVNKLGPGTMDVDMNLGTTGKIRGGMTSYLNGTGFFLGYESGGYKFSIGSSTSYLAWTGSYVRMYNSRIRMDQGGYSRIVGAGFGTSSQFTDWFGADPGLDSAASETNAIWYIKTDGTAYFNGVLGSAPAASLNLSVSVSGGGWTSNVSNGSAALGTRTAIVTGGTAPYTYEWSITFQGEDRTPPTNNKFWFSGGEGTATCGLSSYGSDNVLFGRVRVDVKDANGRKGYATVGVNITHGTPL